MKKKLKVKLPECHGSLPGPENIAYKDDRASERRENEGTASPQVPDGISGYWK